MSEGEVMVGKWSSEDCNSEEILSEMFIAFSLSNFKLRQQLQVMTDRLGGESTEWIASTEKEGLLR